MEPISEYRLLMEQLGPEKCARFSCGHIISPDNFRACVVGQFEGKDLTFNHQSKQMEDIFTKANNLIEAVAAQVPDGIIVFV